MTVINARHWLQKIHDLNITENIRIMNVCGGHERTISAAGIRNLLPDKVELIPGPGCPVCICPEEDIFLAIQWALHEDIILIAFGDMLRVPVNVSKKEVRTLEQARAEGADVRAIASPLDAIKIALDNKHKKVVFFAAGFETTMSPVAAMMMQGLPDNLYILLSGRLTWPAVAMLLESDDVNFDALIAPGHVSTVMGPEEWQFVVDKHKLAVAVAGFEAESMLAGIYSVLRQKIDNRVFLDNCYQEVVADEGNLTARKFLKSAMNVVDSNWRGIGVIADSGFKISEQYSQHDARLVFKNSDDDQRRRLGEMPAGCDCARVVLGKIYPNECRLYGCGCNPGSPVGPCMVSDEGACHIWWNTHRHYNSSDTKYKTTISSV